MSVKPFITLTGILTIFRKELIQLFRDPYLVGFIIALPIIQLMITGLAIQRDLKHIPTIVCNYDRRNDSIELLKSLTSSGYFDINDRQMVSSEIEAIQQVRKGKYRLAIIIPPDYSDQLLRGSEQAEINLVVDGTNANISKSILEALKLIVANHALSVSEINRSGSISGEPLSPVQLNTKVLYNPDLKASYFLIPGILGIIMHMMTILLTSFAIVRERETGTLEQLMVTPILTPDLMLGKVLPYAAIGLLDMLLTLGVMISFFDIPVSGSLWFLVLASVIFILTSLGMGLMISTTCQTQVQAIQLTVAILLPSLLLTGFVFPLEPMPWFIKIVSYSLPLTYYLDIIRGVVIKGIGFNELSLQLTMLLVITVVSLGISMMRFKKQVA